MGKTEVVKMLGAAPFAEAVPASMLRVHRRQPEVFCFGTRLTPITRTLRTRDPDRGLKDIARLVADRDGGTRIGDSLHEPLTRYGQQGLKGSLAYEPLARGMVAALPHVDLFCPERYWDK